MDIKSIMELRDPEIGRIFARNWNLKAVGEVKQIPDEEISPDEYAARFFAAISRAVPDEAPINREGFDAGKPIDYADLLRLSPDRLDDLAGAYLHEAAKSMAPAASGANESATNEVVADSGANSAPPDERQTERLFRLATASIAHSQRVQKLATLIALNERRHGTAARLQSALNLGLSPALNDAFTRTALLAGSVGDALSKLREKTDILEILSGRPLGGSAAETLARQMAEGSTETLARRMFGHEPASDSFGRVAPPPVPSFDTSILEKIPPNPIYKTNAELAELSERITRLVEIGQRQAELTQALTETSELALKESVSAGTLAVEALCQARNGVRIALATLILTILTAILGAWMTHISGQSSEATLGRLIFSVESLNKTMSEARASDSLKREQEIRTLQQIGRQLQEVRKPARTAVRAQKGN